MYGNELRVIPILNYKIDALEELPNELTVNNTKVDSKHHYQFTTDYIKEKNKVQNSVVNTFDGLPNRPVRQVEESDTNSMNSIIKEFFKLFINKHTN